MSNPSIVVISSDGDVVEKLRRGLRTSGFTAEPQVWTTYPAAKEAADRLEDLPEDPVVLFIDLAEGEAVFRLLARLKAVRPDALTVVANGERRLASVVRAKHSGAWGYLTEPYDLSPLAQHFGVAPTQQEDLGLGKTVCFIPARGGDGASTTALHVAIATSETLGGDCLFVDFDFHCGAAAFQLGLEPACTVDQALRADFESGDDEWDRLTCRWGDLNILTAPFDPGLIDDEALERVPAFLQAARERFRCVIFDMPPSLLSSSTAVMRHADRVYAVCTPEITSLHLAKRLIERLKRLGGVGERTRLLANRVGSWGSLDVPQVQKLVGVDVEWALDNDYAAVRKAAWSGGPIPRESALRKQMQQLAVQMVDSLSIATSRPEPEETAELVGQ